MSPTLTPLSALRLELLRRRGLTCQDKRPLYQYRIDDNEFAAIRDAIRDRAMDQGFPALFVLYAAEWWRRSFAGGPWTWEPILSDLGIRADWPVSVRTACVKEGLSDWGLGVQTSGLHYLGTIAVQGGLPLNMLASSSQGGGWLSRVLSFALRQSRNALVSQYELSSWIESLSEDIPKSYRKDEIFTLLAMVAETVLSLRREAELSSSSEAIAQLDQRISEWRTRFPLPLDDRAAQALVETLIRDVASARFDTPTVILRVTRQLQAQGEGRYALVSRIDLGDALPARAMAAQFCLRDTDLPSLVSELSADAGGTHRKATLRKIAVGTAGYRPYALQLSWRDAAAAGLHRLTWSVADGRAWSSRAPSGDSLDGDMPWLFTASDSPVFLRQGGGSFTDEAVFAVFPEGWCHEIPEGGQAKPVGQLDGQGRVVLRCSGTVSLHDGEGGYFVIRTRQDNLDDQHYTLAGLHYWLDFLSPAAAFKGRPRLYRIDVNGQHLPSPLAITWKGGDGLQGPLGASVSNGVEVLLRSRVLVLPESAGHAILPLDACQGTVLLSGWGAVSARVLDDACDLRCDQTGDDLWLHLAASAGNTTPEFVTVELLWPGNPATARLRLPFPALGVRGFDEHGLIQSGDSLALQKLAGVRLVVITPPSNPRISLVLSVSDERHSVRVALRPIEGSGRLVVRPLDYLADLEDLLSVDTQTDATVRLVLRVGDAPPFKLNLRRYDVALRYNDGAFAMSADQDQLAEGTEVMALRLQAPSSEAERLETESVNWSWLFHDADRQPGSWIVYPSKTSRVAFRPMAIQVRGDPAPMTALARAVGIFSPEHRATALDAVIRGMALDFSSPEWGMVDALARQLGHLPMSNLDIWKRFAASPQGMAALVFRAGSLEEGFIYRFDQELPFAWETVPMQAWRDAMAESRRHLMAKLPGDLPDATRDAAVLTFLQARRRELLARNNLIAYLIGIACADLLQDADDAEKLKQLGQVSDLFLAEELQKLLNRQSDAYWPEGLSDLFRAALRDLLSGAQDDTNPLQLLKDTPSRFQNGVVNLPIVLAAQAFSGHGQNWFSSPHDIHLLRAAKRFDPAWFESAYSLTLAKLFSRT